MRRPATATARAQQERLTRVETLLEGIGEVIENSIKKGLEAYTARVDHDGLVRRVEVAELALRDLMQRNSFAAGAVSVEKQVRSQAQEWARTLTPLVFAVGTTIVGAIWALQQGGAG